MQLPGTLLNQARKIKNDNRSKSTPHPPPKKTPKKQKNKSKKKKNSLCFRKWNFLNLILKHFLYFLKVFLIFLEMKPYTFRPKLKTLKTSSPPKIAYITGNGTF